jgi:antitoxin component YwqK of YwqJK toxin-antitoxin module
MSIGSNNIFHKGYIPFDVGHLEVNIIGKHNKNRYGLGDVLNATYLTNKIKVTGISKNIINDDIKIQFKDGNPFTPEIGMELFDDKYDGKEFGISYYLAKDLDIWEDGDLKNLYDRDGHLTYKCIINNTHIIQNEYKNGILYSSLSYLSDSNNLLTLQGNSVVYHPSGINKIVCPFVDNNVDGMYEEFFKDGSVRIKCYYDNNLLNGVFTEYHISGNKKVNAIYIQGIQETEIRYFDDGYDTIESILDRANTTYKLHNPCGDVVYEYNFGKNINVAVYADNNVIINFIANDHKFTDMIPYSTNYTKKRVKSNVDNYTRVVIPYTNNKIHGDTLYYVGDDVYGIDRHDSGVLNGISFRKDSLSGTYNNISYYIHGQLTIFIDFMHENIVNGISYFDGGKGVGYSIYEFSGSMIHENVKNGELDGYRKEDRLNGSINKYNEFTSVPLSRGYYHKGKKTGVCSVYTDDNKQSNEVRVFDDDNVVWTIANVIDIMQK